MAPPPQTIRILAGCLHPGPNERAPIALLDPGAGEGAALAALAEGLREHEARTVRTYGVELSHTRAQKARDMLDEVVAGDWVDRVRRRPLLITADVGRALLLASIPTARLLGLLSLVQLYVVAALVATLATFSTWPTRRCCRLSSLAGSWWRGTANSASALPTARRRRPSPSASTTAVRAP